MHTPLDMLSALSALELALKKHRVRNGTWENRDNHKLALDIVRKELDCDIDIQNWATLSSERLRDLGMGGLLRTYYSSSAIRFVESNIESKELTDMRNLGMWPPRRGRHHRSKRSWTDTTQHKVAFRELSQKIGADVDPMKWYKVTANTFRQHGLAGLLVSYYHGSPKSFLESNMDPEQWAALDHSKFRKTAMRKHEKEIAKTLLTLCTDHSSNGT